jgi:ribosomal protein S12 methylthiotransferase accessory factor
VRPNSRSLSVSQGKGVDADAARVSAMMESIELWHAERIVRPLRRESYRDARRRNQVAELERLPRASGAIVRPQVPLTWIEGWDLVHEEPVWVPYECVDMNSVGEVAGQQIFSNTSNGLASGNHPLEAIEHGLCEIVERDAFALWQARGERRAFEARIALDSERIPALAPLFDAFDAAELDVALFDMTSDLRIPAYCCAVSERGERAAWRRLGVSWGYGCHLSPTIALSRALTEAAQDRLTIISGSRDDLSPKAYAEQDPQSIAQLRQRVFGVAPAHRFDESVTRETDSFDGDLALIIEQLRQVGLDRVIVVDLSKPEIGIPVVKVLVPGLEGPPMAPDYAAGDRARRVAAEVRA